MKQISKYFIQGLLFIVPVFVTLYVIFFLFVKIDRLLGLPIPGLGVAMTLACITLIGFFVSNVLTSGVARLVDTMFARLPLAGNLIIVAAKQVVPLHAEPGDVMKFIVSGGVTSLKRK